MEPKQKEGVSNNLPFRKEVRPEEISIPEEIEKMKEGEGLAPSEEVSTTKEKRPLSELEKIEIKEDRVKTTPPAQDQQVQDLSDQQPPVLTQVDPQDQLTQEEIEIALKKNAHEAIRWLAQWWQRQMKILELKKKLESKKRPK